MKPAEIEAEMQSRASLLNFVQGLLNMNPFERWTPHQAAMHPFITESKYVGPFVPSMAVKQPQQQHQQPIHQYSVHQFQKQPANQTTNNNWFQPPQQQQQQQQQQPKLQKPPIPSITVQTDSMEQNQKRNMYYGNTIPQMPPKLTVSNASSSGSKPPYPTEHSMPSHIPPQQQQQQPYQQLQKPQQQMLGTGWSTRRPRASTIGNMARVPPPIQRATALMNPSQPIRAQPSPAYLPPPEMINNSGQNHNDEAIRHLEDGLKNNWR